MKPNQDYVQGYNDSVLGWTITIPLSAKPVEAKLETKQVIQNIHKSSEGLIEIKNCEVSAFGVSPQETITEALLEESPSKVERHEWTSLVENHAETLKEMTEEIVGDGLVPTLIGINRIEAKTEIKLGSGVDWIGAKSDRYYRVRMGDRINCSSDPITIRVNISPDLSDKSKMSINVDIETYTDIWVEQTELGKWNRKRLTKFLQSFTGDLDCYSVIHTGERISTHGLEKRGLPDLILESSEA